MIWLLWLLPIVPTAECLAAYSDEWCWSEAHKIADLPAFENLATDEVGGYQVGDEVPIAGPRLSATIEPDDTPMLQAIARYIDPNMHAWAVLTIAGESEWDRYADNPTSSAYGYFQFLARWYRGVPDPSDPGWQARQAQFLLEHGGPGHWQYRP